MKKIHESDRKKDTNTLFESDSLEFLKSRKDFEFDINYCDPPYALGSEVIIRSDGKVDYKNAEDFMNKWDMPTGDYWEKWFKEAYRTLKYGGTLIMFGMDRQLLIFKYYAQMAGFKEQQSMYWYYISGFPKATDLSKMIDRHLGNERQVVGESENARPNSKQEDNLYKLGTVGKNFNITQSTSDLCKKYEGYKYSIAPLKQTNETIMIFKKPTKTGSVSHDTIAYENGDIEITVSAIDINGSRVEPLSEKDNQSRKVGFTGDKFNGITMYKSKTQTQQTDLSVGRYPPQTFVDSGTANVIDRQSGLDKKGFYRPNVKEKQYGQNSNINFGGGNVNNQYNDTGGASRILHTIEPDLYHYQPKVSNMERNAGLGEFEEKRVATLSGSGRDGELDDVSNRSRTSPSANNHPTLKPIDLNYKILKLYKTPNPQKIVYPFAGAGSEVIGGLKAGFDNWIGCELSGDYIEIANTRIKYWGENFNHGYKEIKVVDEKDVADGQVKLF